MLECVGGLVVVGQGMCMWGGTLIDIILGSVLTDMRVGSVAGEEVHAEVGAVVGGEGASCGADGREGAVSGRSA